MKGRAFLVLVVVLFAFKFGSFAANAPITTIATVSACHGTVIDMPLTVVNFTNIAAITLTIDYNPEVLTFNTCSTATLGVGSLFYSANPVENSNMYRLSITWTRSSGLSTLVNGSTIFTLNFNYISGATSLAFVDDDVSSCEYAGANLQVLNDTPISTYYINGNVTDNSVSAVGTISGPQSVTPGSSGLAYSTTAISNATSYIWTVPAGFSITSGALTNSITVNATLAAVSGAITVRGSNTCGNGPVASLNVETGKTLTISILPEGLYNGSGLNKAKNASGNQFSGNIADQISIDLHSSTDYATIIYTVSNVNLSITGIAIQAIPAAYAGSYYITIRHRNSIETLSLAPVSFSGSTINYSFDAPSKAYGNNMKLLSTGVYGIFAGDVNQDGSVDASDLISVDNASSAFSSGYIDTDVNGNGVVNGLDNTMAANNAALFVSAKKP